MQVDEHLAGLSDRLRHLITPMSALAPDRLTAMVTGVHDGRTTLIQYQQSTAHREGDIEAKMAEIRTRYDAEVTQAQIRSQEWATAAWASHANAEKYAQMTAVLGAAASDELRTRDRTIMALTHECRSLTDTTANWEQSALQAYHEVRESALQNTQMLHTTEEQMTHCRVELEAAAQHARESQSASDTLRELQACIPQAQRSFQHLKTRADHYYQFATDEQLALSSTRAHSELLRTEFQQLEQRTHTGIPEEINALRSQWERGRAELCDEHAEIALLQSRVVDAEQARDANSSNNNFDFRGVQELDNRNRDLTRRVAELEDENKDIKSQNATLEQTNASIRGRLAFLDDDRNQLRDMNSELRDKNSELESSLEQERASRIAEMARAAAEQPTGTPSSGGPDTVPRQHPESPEDKQNRILELLLSMSTRLNTMGFLDEQRHEELKALCSAWDETESNPAATVSPRVQTTTSLVQTMPSNIMTSTPIAPVPAIAPSASSMPSLVHSLPLPSASSMPSLVHSLPLPSASLPSSTVPCGPLLGPQLPLLGSSSAIGTSHSAQMTSLQPELSRDAGLAALSSTAPRETSNFVPRETATTVTALTTSLTTMARAGDKVLNVVSSRGMTAGQRIRIGTGIFEEAIIAGFGSIVLETPLRMDHQVGETVTVVDNVATVPHVRLDDLHGEASDSEDQRQRIREDTSESSQSGKNVKEYKKTVKIPKLPTRRHEQPNFHADLVDNVLQASTRHDDKEAGFLNEVLTWDKNTPDSTIDKVPRRFIMMDRAVKPELQRVCKGNEALAQEIERKRTELQIANKKMTTRRLLFMVYSNLSTDKNMLEVCTLRHLTDIQYEQYGDENAEQFWHKWLTTLGRMNFPLSDNHKRDLLYTELRKSEGLKLHLVKYTDTPLDDRTYDQLAGIMNKWLSETKEEKLLKAEMRDTKPRAHPAVRHKNDREDKGGKDRGKGKPDKDAEKPEKAQAKADPKGKGKGKDGKKGKAKGKQDGTPVPEIPWPKTAEERKKVKCAYFQTKFNGGYTCPRGDSCGFDHTECASKKEYLRLPKPRRLTPPGTPTQTPAQSAVPSPTSTPGTTPTMTPRDGMEATGTRKTGTSEKRSENKTPVQCPYGANCKGAPSPVGDGSCKNLH